MPTSGEFYWISVGDEFPPFIAEFQAKNKDKNGAESGPCFWVGIQEVRGNPTVISKIERPCKS